MSQKLFIPLLAAAAFAAGYTSRWWGEHTRALKPPPSDFVAVPALNSNDTKNSAKHGSSSAQMRAKLMADMEKFRPQAEAYNRRVQEIDAEFERDFVAVLNPDQKERYFARQKREAEKSAKRQAEETGPLTDERIANLQQSPLWNALYKIACTWRLEREIGTYKLDGKQQAQVLALLQVRREKFIALVDASTPPSIRLSHLATQAQKIEAEPKKLEADAKPAVSEARK